MKNRKKSLRQQHIWFSLWNAKTTQPAPKCDALYQPIRISGK